MLNAFSLSVPKIKERDIYIFSIEQILRMKGNENYEVKRS